MARSDRLPVLSPAARRMQTVIGIVPALSGLGVALYFFNWPGLIGGVFVAGALNGLSEAIVRRLDARAAFAAWGAYIDPGVTDEPRYATTSAPAPRIYGNHGGDEDGVALQDWLLPDGALIEDVAGGLERSPDGRWVAARRDPDGTSLVLYDQVEHIHYSYDEDDAPAVFTRLFRTPIDAGFFTERGTGRDSLVAILNRADRTPLVAWRGLRLPEYELPECREDVQKKVLAPNLVLTATVLGPADCRILVNPYDLAADPIRRLSLNGFPTPFFCEDLKHAMASDDGTCLIVRGAIIASDFCLNGYRWYYRGQDGAWITLDDQLRDPAGSPLGWLRSVTALTANAALFEVETYQADARSAWIQASSRALPFKVVLEPAGGTLLTCRVQLQKFV